MSETSPKQLQHHPLLPDPEDPNFIRYKTLVKQTWRSVHDSLDAKATRIFHEHLVATHPEVLPLFKSFQPRDQAAAMFQTISVAGDFLENMPDFIPVLQELGRRHANNYHVERRHYDVVGECLLWTLKMGLEEKVWTEEVAEAWSFVDGLMSNIMADAGEEAHLERRKKIVQSTWHTVEESLSVEATKLFYKRLFERHPTVIPLFKKVNIESQAEKMYTALGMFVQSLDDPGSLLPELEKLGRKHAVVFKAEREHYEAVGETLFWTLKQILRESWNNNTEDAWLWAYGFMSKIMADAGDKAKYDQEIGESKDDEEIVDANDENELAKSRETMETAEAMYTLYQEEMVDEKLRTDCFGCVML